MLVNKKPIKLTANPKISHTFVAVHFFSGITSQFIVDLPLPNKMPKEQGILVSDDEVITSFPHQF